MFIAPGAIEIYFCAKPTDMRFGFNGLYGVVKSFMGGDPCPVRFLSSEIAVAIG